MLTSLRMFMMKKKTSLINIFNITLNTGIFSDKSKIARVSPIFNPISTGGGYNVPQGYIFVENSWTANDFKLKFCEF